MLSLMITYFSTQQAMMVSRAISKEACDLIKTNFSAKSEIPWEQAEKAQQECRLGAFSYLPDRLGETGRWTASVFSESWLEI